MLITAERRLQILFKKAIHHGHVKNAELNPTPTEHLKAALLPEERCIVLVRDSRQRSMWFTDRRLLRQDASQLIELFSYRAVRNAYWMAKENPFRLQKTKYFDQLELELDTGGLIVEGLQQAYLPILQFLQWVAENHATGV